ncbi:conserved hypothetical protein [Candidatus Nitrosotenuis uzonensis]|uniref:DUF5655 domain-containing protein n=2 Tax=Candidatus Nitrosotenuis uzonensis TaxID=1407055 RepID=A0A812EUZ2_9ARCH|nr:hypothetical protein [Candidatus Nitrosotenuis sp.]CAE6488392.1 conserved hypothetical protein [Candidatus Nitrosotenuis uzonensis]
MFMFAGPKRTFEDFKRQLNPQVLPAFEELRSFCLSLANTVEDVRAHRIVFGKSLTFRWFADMEPGANSIIIKIQRDRKEPFKTITVMPGSLDEIKSQIREAHQNIR